MKQEALDALARAVMAVRADLDQTMSLDEWLAEFMDQLSAEHIAVAIATIELCQSN